LDGLTAAANGPSKIRSLVCKRPAFEENPSNPLGNGENLSSRQSIIRMVSGERNDVVFAICVAMDEVLRDVAWVTRWRFRLSTRTHATSDQFRTPAGVLVRRPSNPELPPPPGGTDGHCKK
jgi:hypothetical protein